MLWFLKRFWRKNYLCFLLSLLILFTKIDPNIGLWEKRQFFPRKLTKISENNIDPRSPCSGLAVGAAPSGNKGFFSYQRVHSETKCFLCLSADRGETATKADVWLRACNGPATRFYSKDLSLPTGSSIHAGCGVSKGCQIFLETMYQSGEKLYQITRKLLNDHKIWDHGNMSPDDMLPN
jgi:hypothetical protein